MSTSTRAPSKKPSSKPAKPAKPPTPPDDAAGPTHRLSLKGSARLLGEFFDYALNTILFQRGVYPAEDFVPVKKYGLGMLVSGDAEVRAYIRRLLSGVARWMRAGQVRKLVVVVTGRASGAVVERWQFDVDKAGGRRGGKEAEGGEDAAAGAEEAGGAEEEAAPTEAEIQQQIQGLFRQITASVTFLPTLQEACTFNVLVYADAESEVPVEWGDSDAKEIEGGEKVVLRSFSTGSHRVGTVVSYRMGE